MTLGLFTCCFLCWWWIFFSLVWLEAPHWLFGCTLDYRWTLIFSSSSLFLRGREPSPLLINPRRLQSSLWGVLFETYPSSVLEESNTPTRGGGLGRKTPPSQRWEGGKMAALASSLIRQKRAVKEDQGNRPVANKRKPCPKSNKSLCQKQILVLISKVRLCAGRKGRIEKMPGESLRPLFFLPSAWMFLRLNW